MKEVTDVTSGPDGPRLMSMEKGSQSLTQPSLSEFLTSVSTTEETTLSSAKSVDLASDSLDKSPTTPANDRFLGQDFVFMAGWQGENMCYCHVPFNTKTGPI
jgi:hypothetical protein